MFNAKMRTLTVVGCVAAAIFMWAQYAVGQCPCASPAPLSYTASYAPTYVAPSTVGYVGPNTQYMPTVVYRALYQPAVQTAYRPVIAYGGYSGYAVTTYRPRYGWTYPARLVPYTTYSPVYSAAMPVVSYMGCSTCPSYSPCGDACGGSCGAVSYATPAPSCSSCAASTTVTPTPYLSNGETAPSLNSTPPSVPQKTFEDKVQRPVTEPETKPIPQPEAKPIPQTDGKLNSMPTPSLPDPSNRTAARLEYTTGRVQLTSATVEASPVLDNDGWQPARN